MSSNLIQFASIFDAAGCKINFSSPDLEAEIFEVPASIRKNVIGAIEEIDHFLDAKTFNDGVAIFAIADFIDGDPNPIHDNARRAILENVGLMKDGRYISQQLALLKTNKSWHSSEMPYTCTYFGDMCTSRGSTDVDGKRGRKSLRPPEDYHVPKANGIINREQLITPKLEAVHRSIATDTLVSITSKSKNIIRLDKIDELAPEELHMILEKIRAAEEKKSVAV